MTKPLIEDTRWAVTAGGVESTAVSVPDGTLKDDGYPDDDTPLSKNWNYWHRKAHAWFQYLNSLSLEGPMTVAGASATLASTAYTASSSTNELTVTGHGLATGAGAVRLFNTGGAPPAPLAVATDYYAVVTGTDTFKIAKTRGDALSGVFVGLTSAGTGTNTVATVVGATRSTTVQVVGDLDASRVLPLVNAGGSSIAAEWTIADGTWSLPGTGGIGEGVLPLSSGATGTLIRSMRLAPGTLLSKFQYAYDLGISGNHIALWLFNRKIDGTSGGGINLGGDLSSTGYQFLTVTTFGVSETTGVFDGSAGPHVVQPGWIYFFQLDFTRGSGGTIKFHGDVVNG